LNGKHRAETYPLYYFYPGIKAKSRSLLLGQRQGKNGAGKTPLPGRPVRRVQADIVAGRGNYKGKGKHAKMERMWRRYAGRYG